jgi:hypothetical protein
MTTPLACLEMAATELIRAKELAPLYGYTQEDVDRLDLLKRAIVKQRAIFAERKQAGK